MKDEYHFNRLLNQLRKNRWWVFLISFTGLSFIGFMTWKVVIRDPWFTHREPLVQAIVYGLIVLGVSRYILFVRQQLSLGNNNARTESEKADRYFQRGFHFWLLEGIITFAAAAFFLYILYGEW